MCAGLVAPHECLGLYVHSISNLQLAVNQIGVFNPSSWNSPRASKGWKLEGMEVEDFLLLGFARTFAGLWRHEDCREAVPQLQPPLQQNRYHHLLYLGIAMQPSCKESKTIFQSIRGISQPVFALALRVQVS